MGLIETPEDLQKEQEQGHEGGDLVSCKGLIDINRYPLESFPLLTLYIPIRGDQQIHHRVNEPGDRTTREISTDAQVQSSSSPYQCKSVKVLEL